MSSAIGLERRGWPYPSRRPRAHVDEVLPMSLDIEKKEAEQARYIRETGSLAAGLAKYDRI